MSEPCVQSRSIEHGSFRWCFYIVSYLQFLQCFSEVKAVVRTLGAGDFFGEIGLLGLERCHNRYVTQALNSIDCCCARYGNFAISRSFSGRFVSSLCSNVFLLQTASIDIHGGAHS